MNPKVIWLLPRKQKIENSASELARETLGITPYEIVRIQRFVLPALFKIIRAARSGAIVYFQFGSPIDNLVCFFLVVFRVPVAAHYLDQIIDGYPNWAQKFQLHKPTQYILKKARVVFVISPAMKESIIADFNRKGRTLVKFRSIADGEIIKGDKEPEFPRSVVFAGNINTKTNLTAILEAHRLLTERGFQLVIYTRTSSPRILEQLKEAEIEVLPPVAASEVIEVSNLYSAQLLPFNRDTNSKAFYRTSTPSKIPNLLMARRRILYFGPDDFWLRDWLMSHSGLATELKAVDSSIDIPGPSIPIDRTEEILNDFLEMLDPFSWADL